MRAGGSPEAALRGRPAAPAGGGGPEADAGRAAGQTRGAGPGPPPAPPPLPQAGGAGPGRAGTGRPAGPVTAPGDAAGTRAAGRGPRPTPPRPRKPDAVSSPTVPSPASHQVVVLLIIAHEIILHVRHLGREGGGGGKLETTSSHNPPRLGGVAPGFSSPSSGSLSSRVSLPEPTRRAPRGFATALKGSAPRRSSWETACALATKHSNWKWSAAALAEGPANLALSSSPCQPPG